MFLPQNVDRLTLLFNKTILDEKLPVSWKEAEVKPIFKKGCKATPGNYRPVSLTSIVCKLFEKFVRDALDKHLTSNNLLSPDQFGFCKGRSCTSQLLVTLQEWMSSLDSKVPVDAIYLDFRKAFDTVPHKRLINKLYGYGVRGHLLQWIKEFLTDRQQYVSVNGHCSGRVPVTSGVPQGSVLGPTLFIYFINDLPDVTCTKTKIFADDTKAYTPINTEKDKDDLQTCINNLVSWSEKWLLNFNSQKCKVLHLGDNNPLYKYFITEDGVNKELEVTTLEKDLGVYVDPELNFNDHINETTKKARKISALLLRTITYKSKDILIPLYKALVRPILEYANSVWCPYIRKHINSIERIQRNFTKRIHGLNELEYCERLKILKLPSLEFRRIRGDLIEAFKILHNKYDPTTTKPLLTLDSSPKHSIRANDLKLIKYRTERKPYQMFFTNRIINIWNSLPDSIVNAPSINSFKNKIDDHLKEFSYKLNIDILSFK